METAKLGNSSQLWLSSFHAVAILRYIIYIKSVMETLVWHLHVRHQHMAPYV